MSVAQLKKRCFVSVPYLRLKQELEQIIELDLQPEIGLEGTVLYDESAAGFAAVARRLRGAGLRCTLHAPFFELYPGSLDPYIRQLSCYKLQKAFDLIEVFEPLSIVCHLGFEANKHGYKKEEWLQNSLTAWRRLLATAEATHTPMMLENTYETSPEPLQEVLSALDSRAARFCLDVGHVMAFAKSRWQEWLPAMSPWLGQLHLHDNSGDLDLHLGLGEGIFDLKNFFAYLQAEALHPLVTLEAHHPGGIDTGLRYMERLGFMPAPLP